MHRISRMRYLYAFICIVLGGASPVFAAEPDNVARYIDTLNTSKDGQQITVAIQRLGQIGQTTPDVCAAIARAAKEDELPYDERYQLAIENYRKLKCPESAIEEISTYRVNKYLQSSDENLRNKAFVSLNELKKFKPISKKVIDALFAMSNADGSNINAAISYLTFFAADDPRLEPFLKKVIAETRNFRAYEAAYKFLEEKNPAKPGTDGETPPATDIEMAYFRSRLDVAFHDLESGSKKSYGNALDIILGYLGHNKLYPHYYDFNSSEKAVADRLLQTLTKSPDKGLQAFINMPQIAGFLPDPGEKEDKSKPYLEAITTEQGEATRLTIPNIEKLSSSEICDVLLRTAKEEYSRRGKKYQYALMNYQSRKCPQKGLSDLMVFQLKKHMQEVGSDERSYGYVDWLEQLETLTPDLIEILFLLDNVNDSRADKIIKLLKKYAVEDPRLVAHAKRVVNETKNAKAYETAYDFLASKKLISESTGQPLPYTDAEITFLNSKMDAAFRDLDSTSKEKRAVAINTITRELYLDKRPKFSERGALLADRLLEKISTANNEVKEEILSSMNISLALPSGEKTIKLMESLLANPQLCEKAKLVLTVRADNNAKETYKYADACTVLTEKQRITHLFDRGQFEKLEAKELQSLYVKVKADPELSQNYLYRFYSHRNATPEMLEEFSKSENVNARIAAASHPSTSISTLTKLSKDQHDMVRQIVAENKNTPKEILASLSKDENGYVYYAARKKLEDRGAVDTSEAKMSALARTKPTDPAALQSLVDFAISNNNKSIINEIAKNDALSESMIKSLYDHLKGRLPANNFVDSTVASIMLLAERTNRPEAMLDDLSVHPHDMIRQGVAAGCKNCTKILAKLAKDRVDYVRLAVTSNKQFNHELAQMLADDKNIEVQQAAVRKLSER